MYYQGLPSLIVPSKMMICGTMTLPYLFRIHLFGVGAKVEDSIISGLVTRQGGYARNTFTYPISCIPLGAWVIKYIQGYADNPAITSLTNTYFTWKLTNNNNSENKTIDCYVLVIGH